MLDFETCYYIGLITVETLGKKYSVRSGITRFYI